MGPGSAGEEDECEGGFGGVKSVSRPHRCLSAVAQRQICAVALVQPVDPRRGY